MDNKKEPLKANKSFKFFFFFGFSNNAITYPKITDNKGSR